MASTEQKPKIPVRSVLKQTFGKNLSKEHKLTGSKVFIGRSSSCQIPLSASSISRKHCVLTNTDEGWRIMDLRSINGTYVNGCKLEPDEHFLLKLGDIVLLGLPSEMPQAFSYQEVFNFDENNDDDITELPVTSPKLSLKQKRNIEYPDNKLQVNDTEYSEKIGLNKRRKLILSELSDVEPTKSCSYHKDIMPFQNREQETKKMFLKEEDVNGHPLCNSNKIFRYDYHSFLNKGANSLEQMAISYQEMADSYSQNLAMVKCLSGMIHKQADDREKAVLGLSDALRNNSIVQKTISGIKHRADAAKQRVIEQVCFHQEYTDRLIEYAAYTRRAADMAHKEADDAKKARLP